MPAATERSRSGAVLDVADATWAKSAHPARTSPQPCTVGHGRQPIDCRPRGRIRLAYATASRCSCCWRLPRSARGSMRSCVCRRAARAAGAGRRARRCHAAAAGPGRGQRVVVRGGRIEMSRRPRPAGGPRGDVRDAGPGGLTSLSAGLAARTGELFAFLLLYHGASRLCATSATWTGRPPAGAARHRRGPLPGPASSPAECSSMVSRRSGRTICWRAPRRGQARGRDARGAARPREGVQRA
jgi:hypothetical protein